MGIEMNRRSFVATTAATAALAATGVASANADEAAKPAQSEVVETIDCDIVVCGLGAAGFMSAITAAKAGSKVVVLEKGEDITACRTFDELPEKAKSYVEYLEKKVGVPISIVAVGPDRDQTIMRGW